MNNLLKNTKRVIVGIALFTFLFAAVLYRVFPQGKILITAYLVINIILLILAFLKAPKQ